MCNLVVMFLRVVLFETTALACRKGEKRISECRGVHGKLLKINIRMQSEINLFGVL